MNPTDSTNADPTSLPVLPPNIAPRNVEIEDLTGNIVRRCYVLRQATYNIIAEGTTYDITPSDNTGISGNTTFSVIRKTAEKIRRVPKRNDTALNDGD
ncbi:MAG: hypothetical protein HC925_09755 [Coleofasciculaceae cyanobacterium SM2_3_26]|nr:hypothetical protein [Coleofasciculaceae cyanobacterium SM2_3_26]